MSTRLTELVVSNFRSIRGSITAPLDAPIVLIHGANGAGKTSLLSALELAATGAIQALQDTDPGYAAHLAHVDGGECQVTLRADLSAESPETGEIRVSDGRLEGQALLTRTLSNFFSERCFLAQSRLSRLLEIYQYAESNAESPLVRFVNDLLGLDKLDELIAGLYPAMDERRVRRLVPTYETHQREQADLEQTISRLNGSLGELRPRAREQLDLLRSEVGVEQSRIVTPSLADLDELNVQLGPDGSEDELETLRLSEARVRAIETQILALPDRATSGDSAIVALEEARAAENEWRAGAGERLARLLTTGESLIGQLAADWTIDPHSAWEECLTRVRAASSREAALLADDAQQADELDRLSTDLELARQESSDHDDSLAQLALDSNGLVDALSAILPHLNSEDCPVCGRDFGQLDTGSLIEHVQREIAAYSRDAERAQELARARSSLQLRISRLTSAVDSTQQRLRSQPLQAASASRLSALSDLDAELSEISTDSENGSALFADALHRAQESREAGRVQAVEAQVRSSITDEWQRQFGTSSIAPTEMRAALTSMKQRLADRTQLLTSHVQRRQALREQSAQLRTQLTQIDDLERRRVSSQRLLASRTAALHAARERFMSARGLANTASSTRADIVARVFNGALNKTWNDLFIRLAADEPYVPFFGIPSTSRRLTSVELGTRHRVGTSGGSPGAMLSAGNLNTAALTLFLALHLTAEPRFPCLILDDPVQSMDEVHVSQLAALLKTLARQHERQIILAVHERALFEYLRLEMSPTTSTAPLVTIELERRDNDNTRCNATIVAWEEDQSVLSIAETA